ncbi:hypothetical protein C8R47DRAFT_1090888 [Mycena vitilis]|nr:hypothetical protein C8R47DRAFT_1090888 [Mycena vitilis]
MYFLSALVAVSVRILAVSALVAPLSTSFENAKRAVPVPSDRVNVQLKDFSLNGSLFSGSIYIKNIAFVKLVDVFYSGVNDFFPTNASEQGIAASFNASIPGTNFETWNFTGTIGATGIRHFYLQYQVNGQTFFDNNGKQNYDVEVPVGSTANATGTSASIKASSACSMASLPGIPFVWFALYF